MFCFNKFSLSFTGSSSDGEGHMNEILSSINDFTSSQHQKFPNTAFSKHPKHREESFSKHREERENKPADTRKIRAFKVGIEIKA